jgi:hypothetical protein
MKLISAVFVYMKNILHHLLVLFLFALFFNCIASLFERTVGNKG